MLLGADNWSVEIAPNPDKAINLPVHSIALTVNGVHLAVSLFSWTHEHQTAEPKTRASHRPAAEEDPSNLSRSLSAGYQRSVGLCNNTARCRCVGDSVEHDEIVDRADVAGTGDAHVGLPQLARVGLPS